MGGSSRALFCVWHLGPVANIKAECLPCEPIKVPTCRIRRQLTVSMLELRTSGCRVFAVLFSSHVFWGSGANWPAARSAAVAGTLSECQADGHRHSKLNCTMLAGSPGRDKKARVLPLLGRRAGVVGPSLLVIAPGRLRPLSLRPREGRVGEDANRKKSGRHVKRDAGLSGRHANSLSRRLEIFC